MEKVYQDIFFILLLSMKYLDFDTSLLNAELLVSFFLKIDLLLLEHQDCQLSINHKN